MSSEQEVLYSFPSFILILFLPTNLLKSVKGIIEGCFFFMFLFRTKFSVLLGPLSAV